MQSEKRTNGKRWCLLNKYFNQYIAADPIRFLKWKIIFWIWDYLRNRERWYTFFRFFLFCFKCGLQEIVSRSGVLRTFHFRTRIGGTLSTRLLLFRLESTRNSCHKARYLSLIVIACGKMTGYTNGDIFYCNLPTWSISDLWTIPWDCGSFYLPSLDPQALYQRQRTFLMRPLYLCFVPNFGTPIIRVITTLGHARALWSYLNYAIGDGCNELLKQKTLFYTRDVLFVLIAAACVYCFFITATRFFR